jgi:hypothetical protein
VHAILAGKTTEQLTALQASIVAKLASGAPVDAEYWEALLKALLVYKARVCPCPLTLETQGLCMTPTAPLSCVSHGGCAGDPTLRRRCMSFMRMCCGGAWSCCVKSSERKPSAPRTSWKR